MGEQGPRTGRPAEASRMRSAGPRSTSGRRYQSSLGRSLGLAHCDSLLLRISYCLSIISRLLVEVAGHMMFINAVNTEGSEPCPMSPAYFSPVTPNRFACRKNCVSTSIAWT
ncbi:hypothetical protein AGR5A_pa30187 [Agrobacterium genomosp. 5 str. CFBP 6626]|nr:hypothetical protein AGR5A_pa30187 [Agrobacterium genomosp. 5 str. CFBP 6626]